MFQSLRSRSFAIGLIVGLVLFTGCETSDYEPLRAQKRVHDLESEVDALKNELAGAKGSTVPVKTPESESGFSTPLPTTNSGSAKPKFSLAEEQTLVTELEGIDAFFAFDKDGFVIELDLIECRQSNEALEKVVEFSRLKKVLLAGPRTDSATYDLLAKVQGLEYLDLERSNPSGEDFAKLKTLPKLKFMQLKLATLSEDAVKELAGFPALEQVRCAKTRVGDQELQHLTKLKTLRAIDLSDCNRVTPAGLEYLAECPKLAFLKVWGKSIGNESMDVVANMSALRVLGLVDTAVTDEGIEKLAGLKLSEVHLFRTSIGDDAVKVLAAMPSLKVLNLRDTSVTDQAMSYIENMPSLTKLDLSECTSPGITDVGAASISKIDSLEDLNLWSTKVTDVGVANFATMPNLRKLNLDNCVVTDECVKSLAKMKQLNWLHLGKTQVTDDCVELLMGMTGLRKLDLNGTSISQDSYYDLLDTLAEFDCEIIGP